MSSSPQVSIVIPAYNEAEAITPVLDRIADQVDLAHEVLVVVDSPDDNTIGAVENWQAAGSSFCSVIINDVAAGPAGAIKAGFKAASAPVVVVTMADGADDPSQIEGLARLVERGVVIAGASRYIHSGQQIGGPTFKKFLSSLAGRSLKWFARTGITDATNSFKAYDKAFVEAVGIHSTKGFEVGIELVAKARRARQPMAELPTIWIDRAIGNSKFELMTWLPEYVRWYRFAFGPRLTNDEIWNVCEETDLGHQEIWDLAEQRDHRTSRPITLPHPPMIERSA